MKRNQTYTQTVIRVKGNTFPHKDRLKAVGLTYDKQGKHWYSIRLNTVQRGEVVNLCKYLGLECESENRLLNFDYMKKCPC